MFQVRCVGICDAKIVNMYEYVPFDFANKL